MPTLPFRIFGSRHAAPRRHHWLSACVVLLGLACAAPQARCAEGTDAPPFRELPEIKSVNGVLTATLEAKEQKVHLGPLTFDGETYNGDYAGPVLRARPGEVMNIKLVNHLTEPTNLHFHGSHGSPLGRGDNMHVVVAPGQSYTYQIKLPATQPPGLYWYHAHIHGAAERQIGSGLSGAFIVDGIAQQLPPLANVKEKLFVLKDHPLTDSDDPEVKKLHKIVQTINGQMSSSLRMRPGETQFWRFSNQSANLIFSIALKGHKFRVIATDGVVTNQETLVDTLTVLPAGRMEVLVDAGEPGSYDLVAEHTLTGTGDNLTVERVLGSVAVAGEPMASLPRLTSFPDKPDLRAKPIDARREFTFSQPNDGSTFLLNGQRFDHNRIDTRVPLGNVEEWTIKNDTDDMHVFHIHQLHFQVVAINGQPQPFEGYVDDVRVPERGSVTLILPFTEPQIVGTFMYHCHVLKHEDGGMMANIEVYDPHSADASAAMPMHHH